MAPSATSRKSVFRPCIDLHDGRVKQIVGGTLSDHNIAGLKTNFVTRLVCPYSSPLLPLKCWDSTCSQSAGDFARLYKENGLEGGHVIKLGPRNDAAANEALAAWPGSFSCAFQLCRSLIC
jgi:phosphoribosylformimino-5-aminoimidazole carboxamide ribotide isomerase